MVAEPQWSWGWGADAKRGCCDLWKIDTGLLWEFVKRPFKIWTCEDEWTCANESKYFTRHHCESASAPAGMVSGDGSHLNTGTTPVFSMAGPQGPPLVLGPGVSADPLQVSGVSVDPLQGPGDPWATTPCISFAPSTSPAGQWTEWQLSCYVWNAARVFRFWFFWASRPSTGIHHCHSSRPSDGTNAAPTSALNPRGYGSSLQDRTWTSATTSAADTNSSAELCRVVWEVDDGYKVDSSSTTAWLEVLEQQSSRVVWFQGLVREVCIVALSCPRQLCVRAQGSYELAYPVVSVNQDQAIRSRRLFHLLQQSFLDTLETTWWNLSLHSMAFRRQMVLSCWDFCAGSSVWWAVPKLFSTERPAWSTLWRSQRGIFLWMYWERLELKSRDFILCWKLHWSLVNWLTCASMRGINSFSTFETCQTR